MIRTHTFRGVKYQVNIDLEVEGYAETPSADRRPRGIYISPNLGPQAWLETAIHEAMHAEDGDVPESVIDRRAKSLTRWLWRLGYRRT